jgi:hypothetical protein
VKQYWSENGTGRLELLGILIAQLNERRWSKTIDTGWERWDVDVFCHPWVIARLTTAQEEHGGGRSLLRVRYEVRSSGYTRLLWALGAALVIPGILFWSWPIALAGGLILASGFVAYGLGLRRAASTMALVDSVAAGLEMLACDGRGLAVGPNTPQVANGEIRVSK